MEGGAKWAFKTVPHRLFHAPPVSKKKFQSQNNIENKWNNDCPEKKPQIETILNAFTDWAH